MSLFFLLFLTGFSYAAFDSFITMECAFSTPSKAISVQAVQYASNVPQCVALKLDVTLPNKTLQTYSPTGCSAGVHNFSVSAPVNGLYNLKAYYSTYSSECSVAALFFETRPRVPEFHPLLVLLAALSALAVLRAAGGAGEAGKKAKGI